MARKLSDGSVAWDLILRDGANRICLACDSEDTAYDLLRQLDDLTDCEVPSRTTAIRR